jgi:hypothetical protein
MNHNQAVKGLRVKSHVKAGAGSNGRINVSTTSIGMNHSHAAKRLRIESGVKAGGVRPVDGSGQPA